MVFVLNCFVFLNMVKVQTSYQGVFLFLVFLVLQENCKGRRLPWDFTVECVGAGAIV